MATIANPNVDDVIVMKHHGDKLAVVTKVEGTTMKVKFMKGNGDVTNQHPVTIDSDKWRPISDEDKKCIRNEGGTELTGTIQDFDTDDLQFTIQWENDTEQYCDFNKFVSAHAANKKSTTGDKRPRTDVEEGGEEVREWLSSIGLSQYADKVIEMGLTDLNRLQTKVDLKKLEKRCEEFMKPFHVDTLIEELNGFREAPVSVALADISQKDPSDKSGPDDSSLRSATAPSLLLPSAASQGMLSPAASIAPDPLGLEITDPLGLEKV